MIERTRRVGSACGRLAALTRPRFLLPGLLAATLAATPLTSGGAGAAQLQSESPGQLPPVRLAPLSGPVAKVEQLDSRLQQLAAIYEQQGLQEARRFARNSAVPLSIDGMVRVLIHLNATPEFRAQQRRAQMADEAEEVLFEALGQSVGQRVRAVGGVVRRRIRNRIAADVPFRALRQMEGPQEIVWIEPELLPRRTEVVSQGVQVVRADELQRSSVAYQPESSIRVGVLDLGFRGYQGLLGSELPSSVTAQSFSDRGIENTGGDVFDAVHGTACAEIVHDMVPEAQLFFANFDDSTSHLDAVNWLIAQNVNVISYSIGWVNAGPGDGRGAINEDVQLAMSRGITWVGAAGNDARRHWQGTFSDPDGNGWHNYAPGDETNAIFLEAGEQLIVWLNWNDWFSSDQDYDLCILDSNLEILFCSQNAQTGSQVPTEAIGIEALVDGVFHVAINRWSASRDVVLEAFFDSPRQMQYNVPAGSLTIPADTEGSVAVAATYWGDDVIEPFSSLGPTTDGRIKPDIAAPDGVATRSYGDLGEPRFFGTSASTPHVAGAVALMKSRFGVFTLDDIVDILYGRALDRGIAGKDNTYGHGRLDVIGR